jgi:two-component system response regulator
MASASILPRVLLVDDNPGDIELTKIAFESNNFQADFSIASDGAQAIDFLRRIADDGDAARPDLILLDLNLPKVHGLDIVTFIKGHPRLKDIATIILTTSSAPQDRKNCEKLGADRYLIKPSGFEDFLVLMRQLEPFLRRKSA